MGYPPYFDGPPRFDVGLRPIDLNDWLLPDDQVDWLPTKNDLIDSRPQDVFAQIVGSLPAQSEAAALIGATCQRPLCGDEPALMAASRLVSDDLVIMQSLDGIWTATACCLCSPTFFSAHHALGKSLLALHAPVPDGTFGLADRIGRVFTNLAPTTILERHNWTVQYSDARFTPDAAPLRQQAERATIDQARDKLFLRIERQTIRRLPQTGAILFTIRIRLSPLVQLLSEPQHLAAFRAAWDAAPEAVRSYKRWGVLERHVAALIAGHDSKL
jgi:hypothetical protein